MHARTSKGKPGKLTCALVALALLGLLDFSIPTASRAEEASQFFPETSHTVSGKFLAYWRANGGLATYGYPITEAQNEVDPETGKTFLTQWFERNRFELHPENAGTQYEVLLGLLGKDLKREALEVDSDYVRNNALSQAGSYYFNETGHNVSSRFLEYWQKNGGLARFGYPISEQVTEVDPQTGQLFDMQWFERARFELHPENKAPFDILLGLLGNQLKQPMPDSMEYTWKVGSHRNYLNMPSGLALDSKDNIYVTDHDKKFALKYDPSGQPVMKWTIPNQNGRPTALTGVVLDRQDNIYLSAGRSLYKLDQNGQPLMQLELNFDTYGEISSLPFKVDSRGNIYVLDNSGLKKFNSKGQELARWIAPQAGNSQPVLVYALDIDRQDNLYLLEMNQVRKLDSNLNKLTSWTIEKEELAGYDLAVDAQNNVYVVQNYLYKYDSTGRFLARSAKPVSDGSAFGRGLVVNSQGAIYNFSRYRRLNFTDASGGNGYSGIPIGVVINKYDQAGNLLQSFGNKRQSEGNFISPSGIVSVGGSEDLYIIDQGNNRVQVLDKTGHYLRSWDLGEIKFGHFESSNWLNQAEDLAVDRQGNTFVVFRDYIRKYSPGGQILLEWEYNLPENSRYFRPAGIALDSQGNVYVTGNNQIEKYSGNGQLLLSWGNPRTSDGLYRGEADLAIDSHDIVYVLDDSVVQKFDRDGKLLGSWGESGEKAGQLFAGQHIALDRQENIYISEYYNYRIQKFDNAGRHLATWLSYWGIEGSCGSQACSVRGMTVDSQNNLYITHSGNDFIQKAHLR